MCTKRKVRGHRSAERTDVPRDKFMNFVGIWGSCRAGLRCADLDPFCVTRRLAFYAALLIISDGDYLYIGDIIRELENEK